MLGRATTGFRAVMTGDASLPARCGERVSAVSYVLHLRSKLTRIPHTIGFTEIHHQRPPRAIIVKSKHSSTVWPHRGHSSIRDSQRAVFQQHPDLSRAKRLERAVLLHGHLELVALLATGRPGHDANPRAGDVAEVGDRNHDASRSRRIMGPHTRGHRCNHDEDGERSDESIVLTPRHGFA